MSPPARWTKMESPVEPANDDGVSGTEIARAPPTPVTLRLDRRVHLSARALGGDGVAGRAGE